MAANFRPGSIVPEGQPVNEFEAMLISELNRLLGDDSPCFESGIDLSELMTFTYAEMPEVTDG